MSGFGIASIVAAVTFLIHTFVGSRYVVAPLLAAEGLPPISRWMMFYCWHMTTITLAAMTAGFAWGEWGVAPAGLGSLLTGLAAAFAALCLYVCLRSGLTLWRVPAMVLFTLMTAAGAWSVFA